MRSLVIIIWSILFLVALMSLIFLLKKSKKKLGKLDLVLQLVIGFLSFGMGYLICFIFHDDDHNFIWVFRSSFALLGVIQAFFITSRAWAIRDRFNLELDSFVVEFSLCLTGAFFCSVMIVVGAHYFLYANFSYTDLSAGLWDLPIYFMLPFLFLKLFDFAGHIPLREVRNPWVFPLEPINPSDWPWNELVEVNFQLKRSLLEEHDLFSWIAKPWIEAPSDISIGSVFQLCMQERRGRTELVSIQDLGDEYSGTPRFCWGFWRKFIWYKPTTWKRASRRLNPALSLKLNKIEKGDIIIARRISGDGAKVLDANNEPIIDEDSNKTVIIKR